MKDPVRLKRKQSFQGAELASSLQRIGRNGYAAADALKDMSSRMKDININLAGMTQERRAGPLFEEFIAGTHNANARQAGNYSLAADAGTLSGFPNHGKVDIRVTSNGTTIAEAQAKCWANPKRSAVALAKPKYEGTQRIVPKGQVETVKTQLEKSAAAKARSTNPQQQEIGRVRAETASKVSDKLSAGGVESDSISAAEANDLAKGDFSKVEVKTATVQMKAALKGGAISGAAVGAVMSTATNGLKAYRGEISAGEAAKAIAVDTVTSGARGAAMAAAAECIKIGAELVVKNGALKAVMRGSAPLAVVGCGWELLSDGVQGKLTKQSAANSVATATVTYAAAEAGAALGTLIFPGVGTVVGGLVGGFAGSYLFKQRKEIAAWGNNRSA